MPDASYKNSRWKLLLLHLVTPWCAVAIVPKKPVRLITWNLLAPLYAPPNKYPRIEPSYLDWSYRKSKIVETIFESEADLVCLQEVQIDLWEDFQACILPSPDSFVTVIQNVTRQHPVCCVVMAKSDRWKIVSSESRSRALIVVLEDVTSSYVKRLYLVNVHLEAGYDKEATRLNQAKSLLKRLHHHVDDNDRNPAIIIAGDFNTWTRASILFSVLTGSLDKDCGSSRTTLTGQFPSHLPNQLKWASLLPLINVHEKERPTLTYAGGSVLDYVWVSPRSINIVEALSWVPTSPYQSDRELYSPESWPSKDCPSDHVPVGVSFTFGSDGGWN